MSSLRSALDELRAEDLGRVSDEGLEEDLVELEHASRALEAERCRRLGEVDRRGSWERDERIGLTAWVARALRIPHAAAARMVALARSLRRMRPTREALSQGEVSVGAARVLAAAQEAHPDQFGSSEEVLVDAARTLPYRELTKAVSYWRQAAEPERVEEDAERGFQRRRLHVSPTFEGMVRVDGDLDPVAGQTLITALRAVTDAEVKNGGGTEPAGTPWPRPAGGGEHRTPAQRRADALGEICRRFLDSPDRPVGGGERPHVTVVVDLEALAGRAGRPGEAPAGEAPAGARHRCELPDVGPISPETARRMACDAGITRVITRGRSEVLDVGRQTPNPTAAIRKALALRDGGCAFPDCDRPPSWCDAHHIRHWAKGGPTALSNLVLLCRVHHGVIHAPNPWRVEMREGKPSFFIGTSLDPPPG